jgi:hypothetical protein
VLLHVLFLDLLQLIVLLGVAKGLDPRLDLLLAVGPQPVGPSRELAVILAGEGVDGVKRR